METPKYNPFTVEIQDHVAKLLAKENVTIQRSANYKTAFFDMEKRLLGLPTFSQKVPRQVYDLFIGHEVGHALFTQIDDMKAFLAEIPKHDLYNILEDIRIEKKIQSEYPGLAPMFKAGYTSLWDSGFFGTADWAKVNGMGFLDRLNLYAKLGAESPILFSDEEQDLVDRAMSMTTADDVLDVGKSIRDFVKSQPKSDQPEAPELSEEPEEGEGDPEPGNQPEYSPEAQTDGSGDNDGESESDEESEEGDDKSDSSDGKSESDEESEEGDDGTESESKDSDGKSDEEDESKNIDSDEDNESKKTGSDNGEQQTESDMERDPLESETERSMSESLDEAREDCYGKGFEFVEPTKEEYYRRVIDFKAVFDSRESDMFDPTKNEEIFAEYKKFMAEAKPTIAMLTNNFQQKKAAYQYSRSKVARRGVIDVNALHKYKYDDNIFLSNTQLANAKSHGMVFMIDQSGSMQGSRMRGVLHQTLILVHFCKKNDIPFSVYTWTDIMGKSEEIVKADEAMAFDGKLGLGSTTVHCICSSEMNKTEFKKACWEMYFLAHNGGGGWTYYMNSNVTANYDMMGATPIGHSLLISARLLKDLKKKWGVQVMNFMYLTDGEGYELTSYSVSKYNDQTRIYQNGFSGYDKINAAHGRLNGHRVSIYGDQYTWMMNHITNDLKVNTIGLFETERYCGRTGYRMCKSMSGEYHTGASYNQTRIDSKELKKEFNKFNIAFRENASGFKKYIMVNSSVNTNVEMVGDYENDTKQLQKDFFVSAGAKKAKKIFANTIIDTICSDF